MKSTMLGAILLLGVSGQQANAELVTNGGFETGDLAGWSVSGDAGFTGVDDLSPHLGSYAFYSGEVEPTTLSQTLATNADESYTLSFWLQSGEGQGPNAFSVLIDGVELDKLTDSASFAYRNFVYEFVATGSTTVLAFSLLNAPAYWDLDDVSVDTSGDPGSGPGGLVPIPAGLPLLASGLGALVFCGWRRQREANLRP